MNRKSDLFLRIGWWTKVALLSLQTNTLFLNTFQAVYFCACLHDQSRMYSRAGASISEARLLYGPNADSSVHGFTDNGRMFKLFPRAYRNNARFLCAGVHGQTSHC